MIALTTSPAPDYLPAWVVESVTAPRDGDGGTWWLELSEDLEYPVADRSEARRWMQRLTADEGGVLHCDGTSRYAQTVALGHDCYALELGARDSLWQVSTTGAESAPPWHDARSLRRVDGRGVLTRVGIGWQHHLHSAAEVAWRWVLDGQVDAASYTLHAIH